MLLGGVSIQNFVFKTHHVLFKLKLTCDVMQL